MQTILAPRDFTATVLTEIRFATELADVTSCTIIVLSVISQQQEDLRVPAR